MVSSQSPTTVSPELDRVLVMIGCKDGKEHRVLSKNGIYTFLDLSTGLEEDDLATLSYTDNGIVVTPGIVGINKLRNLHRWVRAKEAKDKRPYNESHFNLDDFRIFCSTRKVQQAGIRSGPK